MWNIHWLLYIFIVFCFVNSSAKTAKDEVLSRKRRAATNLITAQDKIDLLNLHNHYRRNDVKTEGAANMNYLYWNEALAGHAKTWADKCDFEHGGLTGFNGGTAETTWTNVGQNLGWHSSNNSATYTLVQWYDEKSLYGYSGHTCSGVCGHYTQVVWSESKYLGCAFVQCQPLGESSTGKSWANAYYLVCHYGPPGNYQGTRPFTKGSECSSCGSGSYTCDNGLCRDCSKDNVAGCGCNAVCENCGTVNQTTCTCNCYKGYLGSRCTDACANFHSNCGSGWYPSNCGVSFVKEKCPAMCGTCEAPDGTCVTTTAGPTTPAAPTTAPPNVPATNGGTNKITTQATSGGGDCSVAVTCMNGGTPDSPSAKCTCACTADWQGDTCQFHKGQAGKGVIITLGANKNQWSTIWSNLKPLLAKLVTNHCQANKDDCKCTSGFNNSIALGHGYPEEPSSDKLDVLIYIDSASCSAEPEPVPQDTLYNIINGNKPNITDTLSSCCSATMSTISKGKVLDSGTTRGRLSTYTVVAVLALLFVIKNWD